MQATNLLVYDFAALRWISHKSVDPSSASSTFADSPAEDLPCFRVATWNVWEDDRHASIRHPFILSTLFSTCASCAFIMLQEVTSPLFKLMLAHPEAQKHWMITDLDEQFQLCQNYYSTVIMVNRRVAGFCDISTAFLEYENSRMARSLNVVELKKEGTPLVSLRSHVYSPGCL